MDYGGGDDRVDVCAGGAGDLSVDARGAGVSLEIRSWKLENGKRRGDLTQRALRPARRVRRAECGAEGCGVRW